MSSKLLTIQLLEELVHAAELNQEGKTADYIPELANVNQELTAIAVQALGEKTLAYSNNPLHPVTLQSTGKMIPLIGLLEEFGADQLFEWVKVEPSGDDFASITRLEQFGPKPSNPMLNAGAIALCSRIPGIGEQQFRWLEHWVQKLFNQRLSINPLVFASEKRTGNRNRALAYLLKSRNNLGADVHETLDLYFALCSYEAMLDQMLYLPTLLANRGKDPDTGEQILSTETCKITLAIMATCGLYDETGTHMVKTGMPAKSGVSGYTIAVVPGKAGIVVLSPRVNAKGNSIRGEIMLEGLSKAMNWHFALP
ncbi:TPA: glutaminase A [Legionella pneumophila]|uniref:Glutaminase n=2 Tax=Legionella pneumophila TaxID=446 RepID=GLSA_LEGPH|nr:glutaminase A [Legionella pneumophila]Q5ZYX0.1 RecName: Full=Glutaminase [Legionella pneumophila subsp. pneumophila str. Philadelphia 1]AAU26348.1 glutaminase [Legionella pneumophila subsp. pneumophila str. Philadelphia 1]AEW50532.1 glutaminase [Legionella pneumophila subsp. pneumophila ATCC 43290]AGH55075.1 Glutaminase [Legionella pneumophila subsp. pneumophila LPE509]AGN13166.1 glutaminase [Legionella pneumophila subsp. pneumophila str. Thunder Bay]AOU03391.1 glutaminase A [Legionella pn